MSFKICPPAPKAIMSNENPSWSPALHAQPDTAMPSMALQSDPSYPYYLCHGRLVKNEEIIAPELLTAINQHYFLNRQIKSTWHVSVEQQEEPFAMPQDTFLCRRDTIEYDILVKNPTEEEIPTLKHKKLFMKQEMGYFRTVWITVEYGSTYDGNRRWTRHTVAFLQDGISPYPFQKDCRPEHHKAIFPSATFSS
jgi:hypothetical protein